MFYRPMYKIATAYKHLTTGRRDTIERQKRQERQSRFLPLLPLPFYSAIERSYLFVIVDCFVYAINTHRNGHSRHDNVMLFHPLDQNDSFVGA